MLGLSRIDSPIIIFYPSIDMSTALVGLRDLRPSCTKGVLDSKVTILGSSFDYLFIGLSGGWFEDITDGLRKYSLVSLGFAID